MSRRLLIAIVLAIALPLQGYAAVSAGLCMAIEQQGTHHHMDSGDAVDHHHSHDRHGNGHALCGTCMACCASVAMVGTSPALSFSPAVTPIASAAAELSGVHPAPLERPPLAR